MNKQQCLKTLESLLPLLLYPNKQVRMQVGTYISILANPIEGTQNNSADEESKQTNNTSRRLVIN